MVQRRRPKGGTGVTKSQTFSYKIRNGIFEKKVCKTVFMNFHGITKSRVERIASYMAKNVVGPKDMCGRYDNRPNKIPDDIVKSIEYHTNSFPRRKSHYSRKDNMNRRYLSPELNVKLMHRLYLKKYEPEQYALLGKPEFKPKVTYTYYRRVFIDNFNLSFGHPRTDTCKVCEILENNIKSAKNDDETLNKLNVEKKLHLTKADIFYKDLREKTKLSQQDPTIEVLSFDFEQNMPLPHVPASAVFYMRQLWFYPFCIHKGSVSKSCFYLYVFSDNCAAQNKNAVLVQFWQSMVLQGRFKKISHRYPEPGHSFLPCDRSFPLVEKEKRKKERVYLPDEWKRMIEGARPFFKKGNIKNKSGAKFHISKYKILEFNDKHKETVMCSELASGLLSESFALIKKSCVLIFPEAKDNVYVAPLPLKQAKLLNVMELAKEYVGKAEMWYYRQLEPAETEEDCLTSETEDEDE
nr:unnamed protein product [Callosobruchus analis]